MNNQLQYHTIDVAKTWMTPGHSLKVESNTKENEYESLKIEALMLLILDHLIFLRCTKGNVLPKKQNGAII